jgi:hypothetical protein
MDSSSPLCSFSRREGEARCSIEGKNCFSLLLAPTALTAVSEGGGGASSKGLRKRKGIKTPYKSKYILLL